MRRVFADTNYWIALLNKNDQYHQAAVALDTKLRDVEIVASDMVLAEVLNSFAGWGPFMRRLAANYVSELLNSKGYYIVEQSRDRFISALKAYSRYLDKRMGLYRLRIPWHYA